jgi:hypothetical protein
MCPRGSYSSKTRQMCLRGSYSSKTRQMCPRGSYSSKTKQMCPRGSYSSKTKQMCPRGKVTPIDMRCIIYRLFYFYYLVFKTSFDRQGPRSKQSQAFKTNIYSFVKHSHVLYSGMTTCFGLKRQSSGYH